MVEEGRSVLCLQPTLQPDWVCFKHYKTITLTNSFSRLLGHALLEVKNI